MNTNLAIHFGVGPGSLIFAPRRAIIPTINGELSAMDMPSSGSSEAAKIISRTRAAPSLVATPGERHTTD